MAAYLSSVAGDVHRALRSGGLLAGICLAGCAGTTDRPHQPVTIGAPVDAGQTPPRDDAARPADADTPPDAAAPVPAPNAGLRVFVRVGDTPWDDGLRAHLHPAQAPAADVDPTLAALPTTVPAFDFGGPGGDGFARLEAALDTGAEATAYYLPARRADRIALDARVLGSVFDRPAFAHVDGRPVLFVDGAPGDAPAIAAALEALSALPLPPAVLLASEVGDTGPRLVAGPGVVGRFPRPAMGHALSTAGGFPTSEDTRRFADARTAALGSGLWLPVVGAARNPRLTDPTAAVESPGADNLLLRSLVLARRAAAPDPLGMLLLDGVSTWEDDRQLDPVTPAPATTEPLSVTAGAAYVGYGTRRLDAVVAQLLSPAEILDATGADHLCDAPSLAPLTQSDSVQIRALEVRGAQLTLDLTDDTAGGRAEVLLRHRPFIVPAGAHLVFTRSEPALSVALLLVPLRTGAADPGAPALETLDTLTLAARPEDLPERGMLSLPLDTLAGRRVEAVLLTYTGGTAHLQAQVDLPRIVLPRGPVGQ